LGEERNEAKAEAFELLKFEFRESLDELALRLRKGLKAEGEFDVEVKALLIEDPEPLERLPLLGCFSPSTNPNPPSAPNSAKAVEAGPAEEMLFLLLSPGRAIVFPRPIGDRFGGVELAERSIPS